MSTQQTDIDSAFMAEALRLAADLPRRPWPNPPVGAVVVRDGRVVGRGAHQGAGTPHAEAVALGEAGDAARGATLYCTLEPCNHHGRTPPCAPAVLRAGIRRLVVAVRDPNPHVAGGGLSLAEAAGLEVELGVAARPALELIWPFVATGAFHRPFVLLKTAASLDGFLAPARGPGIKGPIYLTGVEARRDVHVIRRWADVVLVGERTVEADRPLLDGRLAPRGACPGADPAPACADTDASLAEGGSAFPWRRHYVFAGRTRASVEARERLAAAGAAVVCCDEDENGIEPGSLVHEFAALGGHVLMVEGGPALASSFLRAGLVDRWVAYTAPLVLSSGAGLLPLSGAGPFPLSGAGLRAGHVGDAPGERSFTLTSVGRHGRDTKAVWDRLCFEDVLARLTVSRASSRSSTGRA